MKSIELHKTFDAHLHFRQDRIMQLIANYSISQFSGSLLMPNTDPKLIRYADLLWYKQQVSSVIKESGLDFLPIFTMYLSKDLRLDDIEKAWDEGLIRSIKYYPKGGTTGSDGGELGFKNLRKKLSLMEKLGIILNIHAETPEIDGIVVDDYERERVFYETEMVELCKEYPNLKIVLEHITTHEAVMFAITHDNVVATITPQHILMDRRSIFNYTTINEQGKTIVTTEKSGVFPDFMCRPILKHKKDVDSIRMALISQARDGGKTFGLGSDSAVHPPEKKYCECGACGFFTGPIILPMYAMSFDEMDILDHLPTFACDVMPDFYDIKDKLPDRTFILEKDGVGTDVQKNYNGFVTPFSGQTIPWSVREAA